MNTNALARIASLVGEPARAAMLLALMDGRSLTARELADSARITPATASRHLALLVEAGLLRVNAQGRHRYHRLASAEVAGVLEGILRLGVAAAAPQRVATGPRDATMRFARTCYDHLAGRLAVAIVDRLVEHHALVIDDDTAQLTSRAGTAFRALGFDVDGLAPDAGRPPCRPCLDWGERRMHLAGRVGVLLCAHCVDRGWLLRAPKSRALQLSPTGAVAFRDWLGVERWTALGADDSLPRFSRTG
ncbi:MAG: transcriptional regulator, ArsR family-like protein [Ramlibacter sp.]|jgi:DNA-binding transcriptional ArsR family regulator|nr:transcriptional regulator, ArsR family-like protein [Ramlibacter sp.]